MEKGFVDITEKIPQIEDKLLTVVLGHVADKINVRL